MFVDNKIDFLAKLPGSACLARHPIRFSEINLADGFANRPGSYYAKNFCSGCNWLYEESAT